jgi:hypothetical protein
MMVGTSRLGALSNFVTAVLHATPSAWYCVCLSWGLCHGVYQVQNVDQLDQNSLCIVSYSAGLQRRVSTSV